MEKNTSEVRRQFGEVISEVKIVVWKANILKVNKEKYSE